MSAEKILYLAGDESLVQEWSKFCREKEFNVFEMSNLQQSSVVEMPEDCFLALELTLFDKQKKKANLELIHSQINDATILSSSVGITITEQQSWVNDARSLLGISAFPTFIERELIEIVIPPVFSEHTWKKVQEFFLLTGKIYSVIQDRIGMVMPRIICQLVNESFFALQEEVALPPSIDSAMKLGTNYPFGPIEWGEKIGYKNVVGVLESLHRDLGDERYRIAPLLKQVANSIHQTAFTKQESNTKF